MFGKKNGSEEFNGFLGEGTIVTGDVCFAGTLHLDGNVRGSITTSDLLIVGPRAIVEARVKAGEVQISGSITGDVDGARRVEILAGGRLIGDVRTAQLVINEGGIFQGKSLGMDSVDTLQLPAHVREASESSSEVAQYSAP